MEEYNVSSMETDKFGMDFAKLQIAQCLKSLIPEISSDVVKEIKLSVYSMTRKLWVASYLTSHLTFRGHPQISPKGSSYTCEWDLSLRFESINHTLKQKNVLYDLQSVCNNLQTTLDFTEKIIDANGNWRFYLKRSYFQQPCCTYYKDIICRKSSTSTLRKEDLLDLDVSELRCVYLAHHCCNILHQFNSNCKLIDNKTLEIHSSPSNQITITFTTKSTPKNSLVRPIEVSAVYDQSNGKKMRVSCVEYLNKIEDELRQTSESKYGDVSNSQWKQHLDKMTWNCYIFLVLNLSHLTPVKTHKEISKDIRGGVFVLYNYARLCSIIHRFEALVSKNLLPSLPPIDDVDFTLLQNEEEWKLIRSFILPYNGILHSTQKELSEKIASYSSSGSNGRKHTRISLPLHLLAKYLHDLSHCLSIFYNKIHILPGLSRCGKELSSEYSHMLPVLFARIYLVKLLQSIMLYCFQLLGIEPPTEL